MATVEHVDRGNMRHPILQSKAEGCEEQYQEKRRCMVGYSTKDNHLLWDLLPDWQCLASSWHASWGSATIWFLRASTRTSQVGLVSAAPFNHSFSTSRRRFSGLLNSTAMLSNLTTGTFRWRPILYHFVLEFRVSSSTSPRSLSCNPVVNQVHSRLNNFSFSKIDLFSFCLVSGCRLAHLGLRP